MDRIGASPQPVESLKVVRLRWWSDAFTEYLEYQVKLGHRFSQISTDICFFLAFYILVIRVDPCPQNGNSYTLKLYQYFVEILGRSINRNPSNTMKGGHYGS